MPNVICPQCQRLTAHTLDDINQFAAVDYYRCEQCGHAWVTLKHNPVVARRVTRDAPDEQDDAEDGA